MDESRESRLAAILARGLARLRKRDERSIASTTKTDAWPLKADPAGGNRPMAHHAVGQQGEQQ